MGATQDVRAATQFKGAATQLIVTLISFACPTRWRTRACARDSRDMSARDSRDMSASKDRDHGQR
jgi:hypothetical protein